MTPLIVALIVVAMATLAGLTSLSVRELDEAAGAASKNAVAAALHVEQQRLMDLNREYSFWNLAHSELIAAPNLKWADENIGSYLSDAYGIDLALALTGELEVRVGFQDGIEFTPLPSSMRAVLATLVQPLRGAAPTQHVIGGYAELSDEPYLYAIARFVDEASEQPRRDGAYLLIARSLDQAYIDEVATTYRLAAVKVAEPLPDQSSVSLVLADALGKPVRTLAWEPETPGSDFLGKLLLPGSVITVLLLTITAMLIERDHRRRARQMEQIALLAGKDFLTGISNRREFLYLAARELIRARRENAPICLLVCDLDNFKQINDRLGHEAGDSALKRVAQLVSGDLREFDVFARWGGEEFVALLPGINVEQGMETAERLRRLVERASGTSRAYWNTRSPSTMRTGCTSS